jgi:hypothetical protein
MTNYTIDDVEPKFQKCWHYANGEFMQTVIKSEEHLDVFLKEFDKFNDEEKEFIREAWLMTKRGNTYEEQIEAVEAELDVFISGWFETEDGAEMFDLYDIKDAQGLAEALFEEYGEDCVGVDMEFEGVFSTGEEATDSDHHITADTLDRLYNIAKAKKKED